MNVVAKHSPNFSSRKGKVPRMVVIHGDAGRSDAGTVSWVQNPISRVSYHYLIGRDGTVYQFVPDDLKAWHAGDSAWAGASSVNNFSIGVAFANDGTGQESYRVRQYGIGGRLIAELCRKHQIPCHMIRGHSEVSPGRKTDPWRWFDWPAFYTAYGMWSGDRYAETIENPDSP